MRQLAKAIIILLLALLPVAPAFAFTVDAPLADAAQEARARALFSEIRCVVCESEAISDSPAEVARDMRRAIRGQIETGKSDSEIKAELAAKYGDAILMDPPFKNSTALLWFGPWLVLGFGIIATYFYFRAVKQVKP
jgi:cytochrome c-type biogenesis protein CcmH